MLSEGLNCRKQRNTSSSGPGRRLFIHQLPVISGSLGTLTSLHFWAVLTWSQVGWCRFGNDPRQKVQNHDSYCCIMWATGRCPLQWWLKLDLGHEGLRIFCSSPCVSRVCHTALDLGASHHFANKGPSSQSYGFSSGHVWMWELDHKESWALKNWCFWFFFYFIFKLYITVLVLPNIKMNPPQVQDGEHMYTCGELMLLNCGPGEDSWESLELQGDQTSQS